MKTKLFRKIKYLLLTAGCLLLTFITVVAQNGVTVSGLAIDAGTVTFEVSWKTPMPVTVWSDTVWVFVDYNKAGVMTRLPLSPGATLTETSASGFSRVEYVENNDRGVWVVGNARSTGSGIFSATVRLLTTVTDLAGACVYASNYPPVGKYMAADKIMFTGTPSYDIVFSGSSGNLSINGNDYTIPPGVTITSFTDKTGALGKLNCMPPATYTLSGSDVCLNGTATLTLSGSQSGWHYQLYKDNTPVGNGVNGTGSTLIFSEAATATGTFNYTVQTVDPTGAQCEMPVSNTQGIIVNAVPAAPTMSGGGSQCGGTRDITASAGSGGAGIRWTDNSSTATTRAVGTGTYYAVTMSAAGCESAQASVTVTINAGTAPGATVNFTAFNPCSDAATGTTWTLQDTRESNNNQNYKVKKMADGHIWMVQDMKFGNLCGTTFSGSASNQTGKVSNIGTYYGDCTSLTTSSTPANRGYFYDWAAAINKAGAYYGSSSNVGCSGTNSGTSCQGICPSGWHIPTLEDYTNAQTAFQTAYNCSGGYCWHSNSAWEGVDGGAINYIGTFQAENNGLWYQTSTYYNEYYAYDKWARGGTTYYLYQDEWHDKKAGKLVRCIKN